MSMFGFVVLVLPCITTETLISMPYPQAVSRERFVNHEGMMHVNATFDITSNTQFVNQGGLHVLKVTGLNKTL